MKLTMPFDYPDNAPKLAAGLETCIRFSVSEFNRSDANDSVSVYRVLPSKKRMSKTSRIWRVSWRFGSLDLAFPHCHERSFGAVTARATDIGLGRGRGRENRGSDHPIPANHCRPIRSEQWHNGRPCCWSSTQSTICLEIFRPGFRTNESREDGSAVKSPTENREHTTLSRGVPRAGAIGTKD
jgi:hypothetical protein